MKTRSVSVQFYQGELSLSIPTSVFLKNKDVIDICWHVFRAEFNLWGSGTPYGPTTLHKNKIGIYQWSIEHV